MKEVFAAFTPGVFIGIGIYNIYEMRKMNRYYGRLLTQIDGSEFAAFKRFEYENKIEGSAFAAFKRFEYERSLPK